MVTKYGILEGLKQRIEHTMDTVSSIVHGAIGTAPKGDKSKENGKTGKKTSQK